MLAVVLHAVKTGLSAAFLFIASTLHDFRNVVISKFPRGVPQETMDLQ
jgi:hypothetical protein